MNTWPPNLFQRSLPIDENNVVANFVTFNHNGQLLIAGCNDGSVRIYDIRRSDCIDVWPAHQGPVESIELTSDFTSCYTLGHDNKVIEVAIQISVLIHLFFFLWIVISFIFPVIVFLTLS